jgi:hypothetical protein
MAENYSITTGLNKKKLKKRLNCDLVEYKPSMNVLSMGRFMKKHRTESLYYGRVDGNNVRIFYHKAKKRDGGNVGFFGKIIEKDDGCELKGKFRKPLYAYISAAVLIVLSVLCAIGTYAAGSWQGALVFIAFGAGGGFVMLYDNYKKYLKKYLDGLADKKR